VCSAAPDSLQTVLVMTQMAYISAICVGLLPPVVTGGTCVLVPAFDATLVLDSIERFQCSYTFGLPSMVQLLHEEQARKPREVRSLRTFMAGGDCVPVSTQERFQALLRNPSTRSLRDDGNWVRPPSIRCMPFARAPSANRSTGVEVRIVDSDGKDVPDGKIGEIAVRKSG